MIAFIVVLLSPYTLTEIPHAVPPAHAERLAAAGVATSDDLLARAAAPRDRRDLAHKTHLDEELLRRYAQMADLLRIRGVGPEMVKLFWAANVRDCRELASRDPAALYQKMMAANERLKISENPPDPKSVAAWIERAKQLPRVLE